MSQLIKRIRPDQEGGPDRKNYEGVTTVIARNATLALNTRPHLCDPDTRRVQLALRVLLSGAAMYADRLHEAGVIDSDLCDHPECNGARCTANHWFYECLKNLDNIEKMRQNIEVIK